MRIFASVGGHLFMRILKRREREIESKALATSTKIGKREIFASLQRFMTVVRMKMLSLQLWFFRLNWKGKVVLEVM